MLKSKNCIHKLMHHSYADLGYLREYIEILNNVLDCGSDKSKASITEIFFEAVIRRELFELTTHV